MGLKFSNHEIILHALMKIEKAKHTLQERTKVIKCADDFALLPIIILMLT